MYEFLTYSEMGNLVLAYATLLQPYYCQKSIKRLFTKVKNKKHKDELGKCIQVNDNNYPGCNYWECLTLLHWWEHSKEYFEYEQNLFQIVRFVNDNSEFRSFSERLKKDFLPSQYYKNNGFHQMCEFPIESKIQISTRSGPKLLVAFLPSTTIEPYKNGIIVVNGEGQVQFYLNSGYQRYQHS